MLSKAYFSLLTIFCKIGYMLCPSQFYIFFLGRVANVCSVSDLDEALRDEISNKVQPKIHVFGSESILTDLTER
jgi:hypothetical protein